MIGAWSMNVGGRIYGPFTSERLRAFAGEGRLAPHSLIARENSDDWHEARDEPEFSDLFAGGASFSPIAADPAGSDATLTAGNLAVGTAVFATLSPKNPMSEADKLRAAPPNDGFEGRTAHFAIVLDMKSRPAGKLDEAIFSLGQAYRLLPNVWILSTDQTVNAVRNRLVQELGKADSLFVVDASRGKAAWFNFGPEADSRIRRVWQKAS